MFAVDITPVDLVTKASLDPVPAILIALSVAWYLWSVRRLAARGRAWPAVRTASFLFAQLLLVVAVISGLASYDDTNFTIHTIQHIFIGMLAPIFLALSAPITLALQASNRQVQTTLLKVLHSRPARVLTNPLVTWPLYGISLFVLYFTNLYAYSVDHEVVHQLIHVHLLVVGCLFFWPAIAIDPMPRPLSHGMRILYLMLALPFHTLLGMSLESQTNQIAPGISLSDLHAGGGLMWVAGEATGVLCTLAVFVSWLRTDERAARRNDRMGEAAAAAQLAHWRATREAAARAAGSVGTVARPARPRPARPSPRTPGPSITATAGPTSTAGPAHTAGATSTTGPAHTGEPPDTDLPIPAAPPASPASS
jgi:putative copper resistance protein D